MSGGICLTRRGEAAGTEAPLGYAFNDGGLNNQKLALLGLVLEARRTGRPMALPSLFNLDQAGGNSGTVPFGSAYRLDSFLSMLDGLGVTLADASPDPDDRGWQFFGAGAEHIAMEVSTGRMAPDAPACAFFRGLVPVLRDRPESRALRHWVRDGEAPPVVVVQMRIETDWRTFSAITLDPTVGVAEDYLPSFSTIVAKVVNTFGTEARRIFVVCDEAALPVPRDEIRRVCREVFGVALHWKSDLLEPALLEPMSALDRSILDFDMALHAHRFVGLTRSSFSNLAAFERYCMTGDAVRGHHVYNVPGPMVLERHDDGAFAIAAAAVQARA